MKFSKRAGLLLLAVGATAASVQGVAAAAQLSPAQVAATEDALASGQVPFDVPLGTVTERVPLLPAGAELHGSVPSSPVLPPLPAKHADHQLLPDHVVPSLNTARLGPSLDTVVPLPAVDEASRLGDLALDMPSAPLKAAGPDISLGHPLGWVDGQGHATESQDGTLKFGEIDPRLVTAPVSAVPGAKATLGGNADNLSVPDTLKGFLGTMAAAAEES